MVCAEEVRQISIEKTPAAAKADRIRRIFAGWPQISKMLGITSATDDDQLYRIVDQHPDYARDLAIIGEDEDRMYPVITDEEDADDISRLARPRSLAPPPGGLAKRKGARESPRQQRAAAGCCPPESIAAAGQR